VNNRAGGPSSGLGLLAFSGNLLTGRGTNTHVFPDKEL
jgi:hypothetical protein